MLLRRRNAIHRRLCEEENLDADADGIPDIYQRGIPTLTAAEPQDEQAC
ncbi:hypothetical protein GCM10027074_35780 [Streptomyces deserti]